MALRATSSHALIDEPTASVDRDDAIFMLTACAAVSSYLVDKGTGARLLQPSPISRMVQKRCIRNAHGFTTPTAAFKPMQRTEIPHAVKRAGRSYAAWRILLAAVQATLPCQKGGFYLS
jgi:hypothetical protein